MGDIRNRRVVFANGEWLEQNPDLHVRWDIDPIFEFATEAEALMTLEFLAEDYRAVLNQAQHIMRYIKAAIAQAAQMPADERPRPQGIINHTRLARQTVYDAIGAGLRPDVVDPGA